MKAIILVQWNGKELAKILAKENRIRLSCKKNELLKELKSELDTKSFVKYIDVLN